MKMRAKREGEGAAIASSPAQVLHASEKHIIVDHERSQLHLVSSTPSATVPVLNSFHILNTSGLLGLGGGGGGGGADPRSLFSAHLLASIQQIAAATATATATHADGRYQIPLTIQMPQQLYAHTHTPQTNIQVSSQPPPSTIQLPQQVLMSHHDLNALNGLALTESNLNLLQGAQQQQQSQYESILSRLMRGFMETDSDVGLDGLSTVDVHLLPLSTALGHTPTITTTTNTHSGVVANGHGNSKQRAAAKTPRKHSSRAAKNVNGGGNSIEKTDQSDRQARQKRDAAAMADSTTSAMVAAKNKRNKANGPAAGNGAIITTTPTPSYNHPLFHDVCVSADFLSNTPLGDERRDVAPTTLLPESGKAKKRKNTTTPATSTPKKDKAPESVDSAKAKVTTLSSSPNQLHGGLNNNNNNNGRDKVFSCPICKRTFGYKHVLQNHERTHTGEKPFECNICSKKFTRDHHLKTHMRLHTGEKPYQCSHCDRQFVQVANLRRHLRVHTGERPYACEICASKFSDSNQLKAHNLIHKGEKPYNCGECGGKFRRRHHLIHHKCNNGHGNGSSAISPPYIAKISPGLGKGETTLCSGGAYIGPAALSPPLSSSPVAPAIHSGGSGSSSSGSLSSSHGGTRLNGGTKRERKSRETRRIIRPEGLSQSQSSLSPISVSLPGRKVLPMPSDAIMASLDLPEEQTQPQDLSFANSSSIAAKFSKQVVIPGTQGPVHQRHFTGSHSTGSSGTSLSSPSPPTSGGSAQEDSIFAHCNSEEEPPEFTSGSSSSGDEEHHLSGMTPPTSCSSHGGDHHHNLLDKGVEEKLDWRFTPHTQFHGDK